MIIQISLVSILKILLVQTNLLLQILYTLPFVYAFLNEYLKLYLPNFMNTLRLVLKLRILHSPNITTFYFLKSGFSFSYMTVSNVKVINTLFKKSKLLLHNRFQNMLRLLIIAFLWTLKDLSTLLHTTNPIYMS